MTRNLRTQLADQAEHALRAWFGDDLCREDAGRYLPKWRHAAGLDDDLRAEVLSRFPSAEPPSVPGLDWLPAEFGPMPAVELRATQIAEQWRIDAEQVADHWKQKYEEQLAAIQQLDDLRMAEIKGLCESGEVLADKVQNLRSLLQEIKDVVGWFEPGQEERAISLRDQVWELVNAR